jgi:LysR family transcriptional regulator (chromosome initiation inhibitor)
MKQRKLEIHLVVDDERRTIDKLKNGEVVGAISQSAKPLPGCNAVLLGDMPYLCVSTPEFYQKYFSDGVDINSLEKAPAIAFDNHDFVNERFVFKNFGHEMISEVKHGVASSEACVKAALAGFGYCMIPKIQIREELEQGMLIDITPGLYVDQQLYWHHWQLESGVLKNLSSSIIHYAQKHLHA